MSVTKLYVIRHCESTGNVSNRFMGHTNVEITERGQLQLDYLSERFRDIHIDAAYSSPLKRAVLTAKAATKYHDIDVQSDDELIEINFGDFENIPINEIVSMDPINSEYWSNAPHLFQSMNGESMLDVYNRAWPALEKIAKDNMGKTVVVATHGCFIRNAMCRAMGLPLEQISEIPWSNNTAVTLFEFDENLNYTIVFKHDLSHLPQEVIDTMKFLPKALREEFIE